MYNCCKLWNKYLYLSLSCTLSMNHAFYALYEWLTTETLYSVSNCSAEVKPIRKQHLPCESLPSFAAVVYNANMLQCFCSLLSRIFMVWFMSGAGDISLLHSAQTGSGVHSASYPVGTGGCFPWGWSGRDVKPTTHVHLVPRLKMENSLHSCIRLHGLVLN
jgi:hypothetical protein